MPRFPSQVGPRSPSGGFASASRVLPAEPLPCSACFHPLGAPGRFFSNKAVGETKRPRREKGRAPSRLPGGTGGTGAGAARGSRGRGAAGEAPLCLRPGPKAAGRAGRTPRAGAAVSELLLRLGLFKGFLEIQKPGSPEPLNISMGKRVWLYIYTYIFFKSYLGMVLFVQLLTRTPQSCGSCSCAAKRKSLHVWRQSVPFLEPRFLVTNPGQTNSSFGPHPALSRPTGTGTGP